MGLYAGTLAVLGLVQLLMTWYSTGGGRLVKEEHAEESISIAVAANLNFSLVFLASIGVSYVNVQAAMYFWLLIIPVNIMIHRLFGGKKRRFLGLT